MKEVYLAYTTCETLGWQPELLRIYKKSSYQEAYNWLADITERIGVKYAIGQGKIVLQVVNPSNLQRWWIERHEVF